MAPLITHLWMAQQLWPPLAGRWGEAYGEFLLGNLAPDVDKTCPGLEKGTTHLLNTGETRIWLAEGSRRFVDQQADFLRAPFAELMLAEQAFALGYLCHLAADEATTGRYAAFRLAWEAKTGRPLLDEAVGTVVDETAARLMEDRTNVLAALEAGRVPIGLLSLVPDDCLEAMRWVIAPLLRAGGGFEAYVQLVRRNSLWHRHGQARVEPLDEDPEAMLLLHNQRLLDEEAEARVVASEFDIASVVAASLEHCRERLADLMG
jgi:hypothetical protein